MAIWNDKVWIGPAAAVALVMSQAAGQQHAHWAFVAPVRPAVPSVREGWARNPVDRFVQARWSAIGLWASPEATRGELLRRITFTLTGLPPTLAELDAFEADSQPQAYERVVDRLLASAAAAEESTRLWLDLSRYADTHGMQRDQVRALWRWRDWVIEAHAANMPFDRFVSEQLAGDLLRDATMPQRIASGWNRNNPTSDEGGLIPAEYLMRYAMNRTDEFGTSMLGLTVGCAQCHDHKSDPMTQREYYSLLSYFASFAEEGNDGGALAPEPSMRAPRPPDAVELARLRSVAAEAGAAFAAVEWQPLGAEVPEGFVAREGGAMLARGPLPERGDYALRIAGEFEGLRTLRLTVLADDDLPERGPGRAANGNFVLSEIDVFVGDGERRDGVEFAGVSADYAQPGHGAELAVDGDPATGWAIAGRHADTALHVHFAAPLPAGAKKLEVHLRHQSAHAKHLIGAFALASSTAECRDLLARSHAAEREVQAFADKLPMCMVSGELATQRPVHVLVRGRYDVPAEAVARGTPAFLPPLPTNAPPDRRALAAWLFDAAHPLTARVASNRIWARCFGRGLVATPHDFGLLGARPSHPELLDWLACELRDSGWNEQRLIRLLVTSATFRQSSRCTAEQLERDPDNVWLARMSRQRLPAEAIRDQALAVSGLLVQQVGGPSVKIPQPEGIWEAVAFPGSNTEHYVADAGDAVHRRSLYTFWKRSAPPPFMTTFDAPSREQGVVERQGTNTPLQVLASWNDEGIVEASSVLAQRCLILRGGESERVRFLFRSLLQREPTSMELSTCSTLLQRTRIESRAPGSDDPGAWTMLANLLFSLDEALHRN